VICICVVLTCCVIEVKLCDLPVKNVVYSGYGE